MKKNLENKVNLNANTNARQISNALREKNKKDTRNHVGKAKRSTKCCLDLFDNKRNGMKWNGEISHTKSMVSDL